MKAEHTLALLIVLWCVLFLAVDLWRRGRAGSPRDW